MSKMLGPAYAIPILQKSTRHDLRRYVKAEFNDDNCHWYTCGLSANGTKDRSARSGISLFARFRRSKHEHIPERTPQFLPCAVVLASCEDEHRIPGAEK